MEEAGGLINPTVFLGVKDPVHSEDSGVKSLWGSAQVTQVEVENLSAGE